MKGLDAIKMFCRAYYDKIFAFIALLALLISLLYLALQIGSIQRIQAEEERRIDAMKPAHPQAETLDVSVYQAALDAMRQPVQLSVETWTNRYLLFPEERVWCVVCIRPIGYETMECPFCGAPQPPIGEEDIDTDGDGIPDRWEIRFDLDPHDPTDAHRDNDGSGFTSLEQFILCPEKGTPLYDLRDPKSHPPYVRKLYLAEIKARPFPLRFMSRSTMPDGFHFALNLAGRTYFTQLGKKVLDFEIFAFEEKFEDIAVKGIPKPRKTDVSVLTLKLGDKLIPLVMNRAVQHDEYTVHFAFDVDKTRPEVKVGETFDLRHEKYRLKHVDMRRQNAVVKNLKDGEMWSVRHRPDPAVSLGRQGPDADTPPVQDPALSPSSQEQAPDEDALPPTDEDEKQPVPKPFADLDFE